MQKNERIIQEYAATKMTELARKEGKSKEEIFRHMKADASYNQYIQDKFTKTVAGSKNNEVVQASKEVLKKRP